MQTQRRIDGSRRRARAADIGLWHLGASLLVVGGALGATIGLPPLPPALVISLDRLGPSDLARALEQARPPSALLAALPTLPTLVDVELFFRSPSTVQLDAAGAVISWVAWTLWLWLLATAMLRVVVVLGERAAGGARWAARLRRLSDRITLSLVRQAVDATLAGEMLLRAAVPTPAPVSVPQIEYAHVWWNRVPDRFDSPVAGVAHRLAMAPDLPAGDTLYTVQQGDSLSGIAERFYGDPTAFTRIVEANLHREQPDGRTLRDARFIYPGWQLLVPEPTQTVYTDPDGQRWYTVRAGDTLWDISARLLGDPERYRELFADNQGVALGDGHVLTNPNLIWPGLHLRLPPEVAPDDAPQPPSSAPTSTAAPTPVPATSLPTTAAAPAPGAPEASGQPTSTGDGHGNAVATGLDDHREPTPAPSPLPADLPGASAPGEQPPAPGRAWGTDGPEIDLGVAGGLTVAAALLVLHSNYLRMLRRSHRRNQSKAQARWSRPR